MSADIARKVKALLCIAMLAGADVRQLQQDALFNGRYRSPLLRAGGFGGSATGVGGSNSVHAPEWQAMLANPNFQEHANVFAKLMADPDLQQHAKSFAERMELMLADPNLQDQAKQVISEIEALTANVNLQEQVQLVAEQMEAMKVNPNSEQVNRIAKQMEAMMTHPDVQEHGKRVAEQAEAMMAHPKLQEHAKAFADQMEAMKAHPIVQEGAKFVAGQLEAAKGLTEQMEALMANPKLQEQAKAFAEQLEEMSADPNLQSKLVAEQMEAMMAHPNVQEHAKRVAEQMEAMKAINNKDALIEKLADSRVDGLFSRALKAPRVQQASLDKTTLGKPAGARGAAGAPRRLASSDIESGKELSEGSGTMATAANTVKAVVGAGILSLSWSFYYSSMIPAIGFSLFMGLLGAVNFYFLGACAEKTGMDSYTTIWNKCFGKKSGILSDLVIALFCFPTMISYLIVSGDYLPIAIKGLGGPEISKTIAVLGVFLLISPLNFLKDLKLLGYTSIIGTLGGLYTTGLLAVEGFEAGLSSSDWKSFDFGMGWLLMVPAVAFAFNGHFNAPAQYQGLKDKSLAKWMTVTTVAFTACMIVTLLCGVSGYLKFGTELGKYSNVLTAPAFHSMKSAMIAYIATTISVALGYPLNSQALRNAVESMLINYTPTAISDGVSRMNIDLRRNIIALVCIVLSLGVALSTDSLGLLNSVNGAVGGCLMVFIFPSMMYLKCAPESGKLLPWISIVTGSLVGVLGASTAIAVGGGLKVAAPGT